MSARTRGKILVAETPEELEQQLRSQATGAIPPAELPGRKSRPDPEPDEDEPEPEEDEPEPDEDPETAEPDAPDKPTPETPEPPPEAAVAPPIEPNLERYQSRIHIVDAWKYPGSLANRPSFVSPEWVAWADHDEVSKRPAGPALRVPTDGAYAEKLCRAGDYIVRQMVTVDHSLPADPQLDVWTEQEFERLFIPASKR